MFEHLDKHIPKRIEENLEKVSAVLIPLIKKENEYHILFEVRSRKLKRQPGEICFPGGRREKNETTLQTAVRETKEELLIHESDLKIYGALDYFLSPAKIRVEPFLGELINYHGQYSLDEVESIFTVPLQFFLENKPDIYYTDIITAPPASFPFHDVPNGEKYPWTKGKYEVCFYRYKEHIIWGMTAKMLMANLKYFVK